MDFSNLEKERVTLYQVYKKQSLIGFIGVMIGVLGFVLYAVSYSTVFIGIGIIFFIAGIIFLGIASAKYSTFRKTIKPKVIRYILDQAFENASYEPQSSISQKAIMNVGLIMPPDRFQGEDYVSGYYKNVFFEVSDITMQRRVETRDAKGNRVVTYQTYFKGRWYIYTLDKTFKEVLKISEQSPYSTRGLEKVETESIEFNKKFNVYATDKAFAFYIVTSLMLERLLKFEKTNRGQISLCFIGNQLHVGVNDSKDYLELKFKEPIQEEKLQYIMNDFELIAAIINEFKLDSTKFTNRND